MNSIDPMMAAFEGDKRHVRTATPWELFHEASKVPPTSTQEDPAATDGVQAAIARRQEQTISRVSMRAPRSSSFFHARPRIDLPFSESRSQDGFSALAARRRSVGEFGGDPICLDDVAFLLGCSAGVTHVHPVSGAPLRVAPASGGLYELELYVVARRVGGLASGLYHYHANTHSLSRLGAADRAEALGRAAVIPSLVQSAALYCLWTSVIGRLDWKYGQRAYRFTLLNAGHAAQQMCLAATERQLAACPHGGFIDDDVARVLDIDGITEFAVHSVAVGVAPKISGTPPSLSEESGPRIRRFDGLGEGVCNIGWSELETRVGRWFTAWQEGREAAAREALTLLRAQLPGDRTLRNLEAWAREPAVSLTINDELILATPDSDSWSEERRELWVATSARALARVRQWLGVDALPRVALDLCASTRVPQTENRDRWLHRRVVIPAEFRERTPLDLDVLVHEFTHAAYLPHNAILAEGIAAAVGLSGEDRDEITAGLCAEPQRPDLIGWIRSGAWPGEQTHLAVASAASFISFLAEQHRREQIFSWTDTFLYPATAEEREATEECFEAVFGKALEAAIEEWWTRCR